MCQLFLQCRAALNRGGQRFDSRVPAAHTSCPSRHTHSTAENDKECVTQQNMDGRTCRQTLNFNQTCSSAKKKQNYTLKYFPFEKRTVTLVVSLFTDVPWMNYLRAIVGLWSFFSPNHPLASEGNAAQTGAWQKLRKEEKSLHFTISKIWKWKWLEQTLLPEGRNYWAAK